MKKNLAILIVIFAVTAASGFGLRLVFAFSEPGGSPPSSNTEPPITTSSTGQSKTGGLNIATSSGTVGIGASASGTYKLEVAGGTLTGIYSSTSGTNTFGLAGVASGSATGVSGSSASGTGISGVSTSGTGVSGLSASGYGGLFYSTGGSYGVYGAATSTSVLTYGGYFKSKSSTSGSAGAYAINTSTTGSVYGLYAQVNSTNASSAAVYGRNTGGSGWAGYFEGPAKITGNLTVDGTISAGGGGAVSGSGTTNYITKWIGTSSLGNSIIFDNGTNVGIGTTGPLALLEVKSASGSGATFNLNHPGTADYGGMYLQENGNSKAYIQHMGSTRSPAERQNNLEIGTLSTNAIQFRPNDTAAMTIINGGNVGIGTTSPGYKLDVEGAGTANETVGWFNNQGDYASRIAVRNAGRTAYISQSGGTADTTATGLLAGSLSIGVSSAVSPIQFWNGNPGSVKMTILTDGNVGIGTTSPAYKLDVQGSGTVASFNGPIIVGTPTLASHSATKSYVDSVIGGGGSSGSFATLTVTGSTYLATSSGNVGIGTTAPITKLSVGNLASNPGMEDNTVAVTMGYQGRYGMGFNTNAPGYFNIFAHQTASKIALGFDTGSYGTFSEKLTVLAGGNVGIGSTSPAYKLDVNGTASFSQPVIVGTPTAVSHAATKSYVDSSITGNISGTANYISKFTGSNSLGNSVIYETGGNIGIGTTSPTSLLHVNQASGQGLIRVQGSAAASVFLQDSAVGGVTYQLDSGTEAPGKFTITHSGVGRRLTIDSSGNVGIGTTSPAYKLDVNGNTRITGDLTVTGTITTGGGASGWVNANNGIWSNSSLYMDVDNDNNGTEYFIVRNGADASTLQLDETGNLQTSSTIYPGTGSAIQSTYGIWQTGSGLATNGQFYVSGNVGIGTTSPGVTLQVNGEIRAASPGVNDDENISWKNGTRQWNWALSGGDQSMRLYSPTDGVEAIRVLSNGNVGIGTTSPSGVLQVASGGNNILKAETTGFVTVGNSSSGRLTVDTNDLQFGGTTYSSSASVLSNSGIISMIRKNANANVAVGDNNTIEMGFWTNPDAGADRAFVGMKGILTDKTPTTPDADLVLYSTLNAVRQDVMRITSGGNVGIGTTSPSYKLDVNGNTRITGDLTVTGTITTGGGASGWVNANNGIWSNSSLYMDVDNDNNGTEYFIVRNGTDASTLQLDETGNLQTSSTIYPGTGSAIQSTYGIWQTGSGLATNGDFYASGNVGIGTTGPLYNLHISGGGQTSTSGYAGIYANPNSTTAQITVETSAGIEGGMFAHGNGNVYMGAWSNNPLIIRTNSTDQVSILTNGNVGIGTTSPGAPLHIYTSIKNPDLRIEETGAGYATQLELKNTISSMNLNYDTDEKFNAYVGGAQRLTIQSNGNVGIGTTGPNSKLEVYNSSSDNTTLGGYTVRIANPAGAGKSSSMQFAGANQNAYIGYIDNTTAATQRFSIGVGADTEQLTVLGTGNVGIGSTSPGYKLDVQGGQVNASGGFCIAGDCRASWGAVGGGYWTASGANIYNNNSGYVGIGTTSPATLLHMEGASPVLTIKQNDTSSGAVEFRNSSNTIVGRLKYDTVGGNTLSIINRNAGPIIFSPNDTETMRIISGGNVGIGTTSPSYKLDVNGNTNITGNLNVTGTITGTLAGTVTVTAGNVSSGQFGANTGGGNFFFPANVGIGTTSPGEKLSVEGSGTANENVARFNNQGDYASRIWLRNAGQSAYFSLAAGTADTLATGLLAQSLSFGVGNNRAIQFWNGIPGTVKMTILSDGNVGIGTTSPATNLQITQTAAQNDAYGMIQTYNSAASSLNAGYTAKNYYGTSQFMQWESYGLRIGSRIITNSGLGKVFFTYGADSTGMTMDGSGNVGIGTTSPGGLLHTYKAAGTNSLIVESDDGQTAQLRIGALTDGTESLKLGMDRNTNYAYLNVTNSAGILVLQPSGGNVGIGTTSPSYKLDVSGDARITGTLTAGTISGGYTGTINAANVSMGQFGDNTGGGTYTFPGNVGIGTTAPNKKLHIKATTGTEGTLLILDARGSGLDYARQDYFTNDSGTAWNLGGYYNNGDDYFALANNYGGWNNPFIVKENGNVGIGTTSPSEKLHVAGNARITGNLQVDGTFNLAQATYNQTSTATSGSVYNLSTSLTGNPGVASSAIYYNSLNQLFTQSGNAQNFTGYLYSGYYQAQHVGTGTVSNLYGLQISYNNTSTGIVSNAVGLRISSANSGGGSVAANYGLLIDDLAGTSAAAIYQSGSNDINYFAGNVGIGTSTPTSKLHIEETRTDLSGTVYGRYKKLVVNPASTSSGGFYGDNNVTESLSGNAQNINNLIGDWSQANHNGTGILTSAYGAFSSINNSSTGTITGAYGVRGRVNNSSTGTITGAYGGLNSISNLSTGTITNAYGHYISFPTNNGTITNAYGLYINQVLGTNKWGIYVNDTSPNYFAGYVGVNQTIPTAPIHVKTSEAAGSSYMRLSGETGYHNLTLENAADSTSPNGRINFETSRGTLAAKTTTLTNDTLGWITFQSHNGTSYGGAASIQVVASADGRGGNLHILTSPSGSSGSSYRLSIMNDGNVGVGTTSPAYALDVVGSIRASGTVMGSFSGSINAANVSSGDFGANTGNGNFSFPANVGIGTTSPSGALEIKGAVPQGGALQFNVNNTELAGVSNIIASNNNLTYGYFQSIGPNYTNNPDLANHVRFGATSNASGLILHSVNATGFIKFWVGSGATRSVVEKMILDSSGNLGIGTTSPGAKLDVNGDINFVSGRIGGATNYISLNTGGSYLDLNSYGASLRFYAATNDIVFRTATADPAVTIKQSGNVGIGTTSPSGTLHINSGNTPDFQISTTAGDPDMWLTEDSNNKASIYWNATSDSLRFWTMVGGSGGDKMVINSGNVGIGTTSPGAKLDVNVSSFGDGYKLSQSGGVKSLWTTNGGSNNYDTIFGAVPNNSVRFISNNTERMVIDNTGNVGIGTAGPDHPLNTSRPLASVWYPDVRIGGYLGTQNGFIGTNNGSDRIRLSGGAEQSNNDNAGSWATPYGTTGAFLSVGDTGNTKFFNDSGLTNGVAYTPTERMRIQPNGNVGIGTTSPAYKLDVSGDARITGTLTAGTISGGYTGTINAANVSSGQFGDNTGGGIYTFPGNVGIGTTSPVSIGDGDVPKILQVHGIGASGWGILQLTMDATSARTAGGLVFGSTGLSNADKRLAAIYGVKTDAATTGGTGDLVFGTWNAGTYGEKMRILANGNVGIGTTSPSEKLHVAGNARITGNLQVVGDARFGSNSHSAGEGAVVDGVLRLAWGSSVPTPAGGVASIWHESSDGSVRVKFSNGNVPLTIDDGGNVGIGTTGPGAKLDILGVNDATNMKLRNTSGANYLDITNGTTGGYLGPAGDNNFYIQTYAGTGDIRISPVGFGTAVTVKNGGNVGIGTTSPAYALDVVGSIRASGTVMGSFSGSINAANVSMGQFGDNTGGGIYTFPGNVGIGTTSPGGVLQVASGGNNILKAETTGLVTVGNASSGRLTVDTNDLQFGGTTYSNSASVFSNQGIISMIRKNTNANVAVGDNNTIEMGFWTNPDAGADRAFVGMKGILTDKTPTTPDADLVLFSTLNAGRQDVMRITSGGNVGIGTTNPTSKLSILKGASSSGITTGQTLTISDEDYVYYYLEDNNAASGSRVRRIGNEAGKYTNVRMNDAGSSVTATDFVIDSGGNVGIGTTNPTVKLDVVGSVRISTGDLNMNGNSIGGVNKLTVTTIDPEYTFDGKKYATYVASFAGGVKEEVTGKAKLQVTSYKLQEYEYTIDFDKIDDGSDLWLWRKVIDFSKDNVEVLATPYGELAMIAYQIDGNKIIFKSDKAVEISYRLTGRRNDWKLWPTQLK